MSFTSRKAIHLRPVAILRPRTKARWAMSVSAMLLFPPVGLFGGLSGTAQTAPSPTPAGRQIGTVKTVTPNKLTIATDAGLTMSVNVADGARVLQLAPGSTDLRTAQSIPLDSIEMGDRVLVTGHTDAPDAMTASRVILMKSTDIAQKHASEEDVWKKNGTGGLVSAVDPASGTITIAERAKKLTVETTQSTVYRRYANGSVKYEDAKISSAGNIQVGDQVRVRGAKAADGSSIRAEEIVSGSFTNLAGTILSVDPAAGTLTVRDATTKKTYSLKVTPNSDVRNLPTEAATRFAARAKGATSETNPGASHTSPTAANAAGSGAAPRDRAAGADLSSLINKLPQETLNDLHPGQALMVVASQAEPGSDTLVAVTVLSGVEPILAATPKGEASMTLSPWSLGGGGAEGGGM